MKIINYLVLILTGIVLACTGPLAAKENRYNVADIPKNLLANAKAVVRNSETVFEVFSAARAVERVQYAVTVLNTNGINESLFKQFYNSFFKIKRIDASIYNGQGEFVKKVNNSLIQDYSAISGFSLYEDSRVKFIDPKYRTVPFTIEYSFEIEYSGLLHYPECHVYTDYNISVQRALFKVIAPDKSMIRYFEKNMDSVLKITDYKDRVGYSWEFLNLEAIRKEPFSPPLESYTPVVYLGSTDFELKGIRGNTESWKNVGLWSYSLNKGRDTLAKETENHIRQLVANIKEDTARIRILYEYLQNKTRYVSTQIGIGGWQTIDAQTVDRLSYGDCKALTNYMQGMLRVIGVKSYCTLVLAGQDAPATNSAFPSPRFNHVFLCIPQRSDTIWLECTSQHIPFGFTGMFTDDRDVLIVKEDGGVLTHTRALSQEDNYEARNASIKINESGHASALVHATYKGMFYDEASYLLRIDEKDRKKEILERITIPSFELVEFKHAENKKMVPDIEEVIRLEINNCGTLLGDRMLVGVNLMNKMSFLPDPVTERRSPVFIRRAYTKTDTVTFTIPQGYTYNIQPELKFINSRFGEYGARLIASGSEIKYIRLVKINKGNYPASDYTEFSSFINEIAQADEYKIILKKK